MHIIIPMSGVGQRFIDANYTLPKPLIVIDGKTIIEHVCDLFPNEENFTFICNSKHLAETNMSKVLKDIRPNCRIIEIPNHKKGPVYAVSLIHDYIKDDEEVIINYCDFGTYWDYNDFLCHTRSRNADGAIPSYKGFHPHMLGDTNYAFMREQNQWMLEIKEKEPFTNNKMNEYASNGTYYFKKGSYIKKYFSKLIKDNVNLNGEYYVSLVYNLLALEGLKISIYNIQHMLQWGTPNDVEEYIKWSNYFRNCLIQKNENIIENCVALVPLAGRGSRFSKEGYFQPKPLINLSGKPMIIQATNSLPLCSDYSFVTLEEHQKEYRINEVLLDSFLDAKITSISEVTSGQAITCSLGLKELDVNKSLIIGATDNGMIYDYKKFNEYIMDLTVDAVIFTFRNHISSKMHPEMYGWVNVENKTAKSISVKTPISEDPYNDHAIVGSFYFRKIELFNIGLEKLIEKNSKINGEYYVDSLLHELIILGYNVKVLEVQDYICWGTPNDYETFCYWQSFFHKAKWHPYSLYLDNTCPKNKAKLLDERYAYFAQDHI